MECLDDLGSDPVGCRVVHQLLSVSTALVEEWSNCFGDFDTSHRMVHTGSMFDNTLTLG